MRGQSGSGKSSLLARTALEWQSAGYAILVDLRSYQLATQILQAATLSQEEEHALERLMALGEVTLLLDGYEALRVDEERQRLDAEIGRLQNRYPHLNLAIALRDGSPQTRNLIRARSYQVDPLEPEEVDQAIEEFTRARNGPTLSAADLDPRTRNLCRRPLALRLVLQGLGDTGGFPTNESAIYRSFLSKILDDPKNMEDVHSPISGFVKMHSLSTLAFTATESSSSFLKAERVAQILEPVITNLKSQHQLAGKHDTVSVTQSLTDSGVLLRDPRGYVFMHQNVQDYLAAEALHRSLVQGDAEWPDILRRSNEDAWRSPIRFLAGIVEDATEIVSRLREVDVVFAAECARSARTISGELIDSFIVEALYEFKFGRMSFNYELIFALLFVAELKSEDLPERIAEEMKFWCSKYATRPLQVLEGLSGSDLVALVDRRSQTRDVANAIWTLGVGQHREATSCLLELLDSDESELAASSVLALGRMYRDTNDPESQRVATQLLDVALDPSRPPSLRSSCFNSVGEIRCDRCFARLEKFIRSEQELDGSVRENAAWAFLGLVEAEKVTHTTEEFQRLIVRGMHIGTPHARAMFAYIANRFRIRGALSELLGIANDPETDPLHLEDVVWALGEMDDAAALPVLQDLLSHDDVVIRARVVEAIAKVSQDDLTSLNTLRNVETSPIVQKALEKALGGRETQVSQPPTMRPIDIMRRR
ncbi:MAG: HEAT repeat domain-containing protein [Candidatus Nanopelagicales bacterium]